MDMEKAGEEYVVIQIRLPASLKARAFAVAKRLTEETPGGHFSFNRVAVAALEAWVERAERKRKPRGE